jgi:tellurite resistance protein TerC
MNGPLVWIGFNAFILIALLLDMVVLRREAHTITLRESLLASAAWIGVALLFAAGLAYYEGHAAALQFVTGYVIEESLSIDNLFVMLVLFSHFAIPEQYQHRVLFWGILGAMVMRLGLILAGVALVNALHFMLFIFGGILIWSGIQMFRHSEPEQDPEKSVALRLLRRFFPITPRLENGHFLVKRDGRNWATPLLAALVAIEFADLVFAVDSVPAVIAVSRDPFIVYSSNALAILGLRSMYFALAGVIRAFRFLHYGLAAVLLFVGVKMIIHDWFDIPTGWTLAAVLGMLTLAMVASWVASRMERREQPGRGAPPRGPGPR